MTKHKKEEVNINGKVNEIVTILDDKGKILHKIISPLMVEFHKKDIVQVIVGATILAIPLGYTEETWILGETLPMMNIFMLFLLSIGFISVFAYYSYYKGRFDKHKNHFFKRTIGTYILSLLVVALLMTIIQKAPWSTDFWLALKRIIIVAFPASMSAAVADTLK